MAGSRWQVDGTASALTNLGDHDYPPLHADAGRLVRGPRAPPSSWKPCWLAAVLTYLQYLLTYDIFSEFVVDQFRHLPTGSTNHISTASQLAIVNYR